MAKNYLVKATGVSVISGTIKNITEDGLGAVIVVNEYSKEDGNKEVEVSITSNAAMTELKDGDLVTAMGFKRGNNVAIERISKDNACMSLEGTTVLTGEVLFANKNEEMNQDGSHRLTQAGTVKKPHFDITVAVGQGATRETHTVKFYNFTTKDGRAVDNIGRYEKAFANFDRENNPVFVAIVTDEGQAWTRESTDKNGKVWQNAMVSHMGANSVDINYVNAKERTNETPAQSAPAAPAQQAPAQAQPQAQAPVAQQAPVEQAAPVQQAAPAPAPAQPAAPANDGFAMENLDLSGLDDLADLGI